MQRNNGMCWHCFNRKVSECDSPLHPPSFLAPSLLHLLRELPDMMSASEGGGGHVKADIVLKEVA